MDIEELKKEFQSGKVLLLNKPYGWTSFDLVKKIKSLFGKYLNLEKIKVGHAGTLDPLATGLMILCTGKATKRLMEFQNLDKEYVATFHLGETTPSFDLETEVDHTWPVDHITSGMVEDVLKGFLGELEQEPPLYSAKNIQGKRAYEWARKGTPKKIKTSRIRINKLDLVHFALPEIRLVINCSKGTYVRALARDLGKALQSGAYLSELERTQIGSFKLLDSTTLEDFEKKILKKAELF